VLWISGTHNSYEVPINRRVQDEPLVLFALSVTWRAGSVQPVVTVEPAILREHTWTQGESEEPDDVYEILEGSPHQNL